MILAIDKNSQDVSVGLVQSVRFYFRNSNKNSISTHPAADLV